jgi:hypothetical protein
MLTLHIARIATISTVFSEEHNLFIFKNHLHRKATFTMKKFVSLIFTVLFAVALIHGATADETCAVAGQCTANYSASTIETLERTLSFGSIITFPGFFSPEECRKFREAQIPPNSTKHHHSKTILVGEIEVGRDMAEHLLAKFDEVEKRSRPRKIEEIKGWKSTKVLRVNRKILMSSSHVHQDYYTEGDHLDEMVTGNNAIVILNDNNDASFIHGSSAPIPIKEGTLAIFRGSEWHHTQVNSGHVHFLGPLDTDYFFTVGVTPPIAPSLPVPPPVRPPVRPPTEAPVAPPEMKIGIFQSILNFFKSVFNLIF